MTRFLGALKWPLAGVYVAGHWAYGAWFIWEHWSRDQSYSSLAWTGFIRAIIWPYWVIVGLL